MDEILAEIDSDDGRSDDDDDDDKKGGRKGKREDRKKGLKEAWIKEDEVGVSFCIVIPVMF